MLEEICKKYNNEIKKILDALKYGCYEELDQDTFEDDVVCAFEEHYHKKYGWDNGATKGVFIFKNFGFVIKIPFNHCDGYELCGASVGDSDWDYCSQEKNRYAIAKKNGLQSIFLETALIGNVDGYPIYIQPIAQSLTNLGYDFKNEKSKTSTDDMKVVKMINEENNYNWINGIWEADVFAMYGGKYYHKFKNFIKNNYINDLRDDNIGYIGLKPVILDYAGYDD